MRCQMFNDIYGQSEINGGNKDYDSSFQFFFYLTTIILLVLIYLFTPFNLTHWPPSCSKSLRLFTDISAPSNRPPLHESARISPK